jgi:hypothetical protein
MDVSVGGWLFGGCIHGFVGMWVEVGWMNAWMCRKVGGCWVDVCNDVSVGGWRLGGCIHVCVDRGVDVCKDVSVVG